MLYNGSMEGITTNIKSGPFNNQDLLKFMKDICGFTGGVNPKSP
jgi:hypothetical protein